MCAKVTSTYMEFTLAFGPKPEFSFSFKLYFIIVLFQYTILGDREQAFPLYYKDFFEQICSDVQFISPPEGRRWKTVFSYYIQCLKVDWCTLFCANLYAKRTFSVAFYRWWDELQTRKWTAVAGGEKSVSPTDMRQITVSMLLTCQTLWNYRLWVETIE